MVLYLSIIDPKPITLYELLSLIISCLSFLVAMFGFIWIVKSLRTASNQTLLVADSLKANVFHQNDSLMFNIDQIFIDYPDLRKYFYDGAQIDSTHSEYQRTVSIAFYLLDFFSDVLIQKKEYSSEVTMNWWDEWMTDVFVKSPIICQCLIERRNWYRPEIHDFMVSAITKEKYEKLIAAMKQGQDNQTMKPAKVSKNKVRT